jgi:hypothetical protein
MRNRLGSFVLCVTTAALFSASLVSPAAAVVDAADYAVWRFPSPGSRGIGIIHEGATNTTVVAETVGLRANTGYSLVGSSSFCGDVHQPLNALWSRNFDSNAKGAAYMDAAIGAGGAGTYLRSIRLFQDDSQVDCAKPLPYQTSGTSSKPLDAFATISAYGTRLMVFVDMRSGRDTVTATGHGFIASHGYRLIGSGVACPSQPTGSTTLFEKSGTTNSLGILWRSDTGADFGTTPPRSIQLFSPSGRVACARPTLLPAVQ